MLTKIIVASLLAVSLSVGVASAQSDPGQSRPPAQGGWGMMGPGMMMNPGMMWGPMMGQGMMGQGMMGQGVMPGMMMGAGAGPCGMMGMMGAGGSPLSVDQVKQYLGQWLAWQGNPRLKLGEVTEQKDGTVTADVTTQEGSLVQRLVIDKAHGWIRQAQ